MNGRTCATTEPPAFRPEDDDMSRILIIDDDHASCRTLELHFSSQKHRVDLAHSMLEGLGKIEASPPDLIILDIRMPGMDGLEGLLRIKELVPDTPVIMITAFHDMESTIQAMKRGACDYIQKPIDINELNAAVAMALNRLTLDESGLAAAKARGPGSASGSMIGSSRAMKEIFKIIGIIAPKPLTVLIEGESGTGKELVTRAIHNASANASGPFVAVNCAALVETLLESDLFGHEKGAFTGAVSRHPGKLAMANNGTIFLDEVGELSPNVQAKFLRVLQEREYVPVGGAQVRYTNARVVAATNVDLLERVKLGKFREDLYYRLQVVTIHLPPLRERKEDIPELVQTLIERINRELRRKVVGVSGGVIEAFCAHDWPGNVRELENVLMKAVALCSGEIITEELIPEHLRRREPAADDHPGKPVTQLSLKEIDVQHVARILEATNWHRGRACEILEISRPRLRRILIEANLKAPPHAAADDDED